MSIAGVDVSMHQGDIKWAEVAASGVAFCVVKASEGTGYADPKFAANWSGAKIAGMVRGAYHFMRADLGNDPTEEADWFLSVVGHLETGDFLCLDIEDFPGRPQPPDLYWWVSTFVGHIWIVAGFHPFIYSTRGYLQAHNLTDKPNLADCGLWLASWFTGAPLGAYPVPPPDWPFTAMHQHSDSGTVPGIAGPVDLDRFNGTVEQLRLYGLPAPAAPPDRAPLDSLWAALEVCRGEYVTPADVADLDHVSISIDSIKRRYEFP